MSLTGIVAVIAALLVLIRGQMAWARLVTRRVAVIALVVSAGVFFAGIGLGAAGTTSQPHSAPGPTSDSSGVTPSATPAAYH
ncbi:MAG TPA: hypothetical protein VHX59_11940 [Mycobacteriales bacterium]|jgi:hypothetical protein|nr:hypothetical protein [Mycobacteriales bacterium]